MSTKKRMMCFTLLIDDLGVSGKILCGLLLVNLLSFLSSTMKGFLVTKTAHWREIKALSILPLVHVEASILVMLLPLPRKAEFWLPRLQSVLVLVSR